jgi:hypothetical protein
MKRWGRLIELVIVVLVALLFAFGIIYAYRVICFDYGMCGKMSGGSGGAIVGLQELFKTCESNLAENRSYKINGGGEAHEFNVRFQIGQPAVVAIRARLRSYQPQESKANPLEKVTLSVVEPTSETSNAVECRLGPSESDGKYEAACDFIPRNRDDFRIFVTNLSDEQVEYCLVTNGRHEH